MYSVLNSSRILTKFYTGCLKISIVKIYCIILVYYINAFLTHFQWYGLWNLPFCIKLKSEEALIQGMGNGGLTEILIITENSDICLPQKEPNSRKESTAPVWQSSSGALGQHYLQKITPHPKITRCVGVAGQPAPKSIWQLLALFYLYTQGL